MIFEEEPAGIRAIPRGLLRRRKPPSITELEGLFVLLTNLRAANADSLLALFFEKEGFTERTAMRRLHWLVARGYLAHQRLADSSRAVYFLTAKAIAEFPSVAARATGTLRRPPAPRQAGYCWLRSTLHASLVRDGYSVGRGAREQQILRRFLIDQQIARVEREGGRSHHGLLDDPREVLRWLRDVDVLKPLFRCRCARCGWRSRAREAVKQCAACGWGVDPIVSPSCFRCSRCGRIDDSATEHNDGDEPCFGRMLESDVLPFDVALRERAGNVTEVMVVFVDSPSRPLEAQIKELPLQVHHAPKVPMIIRSADLDSVYDARASKWIEKGARHRELLRAFDPDSKNSRIAGMFTLIDYRPELQLQVIR